MRQHQALFANFILKFGEEDLVDYLEEVVLYAFTDDTLYRERRGSRFYLYDVQIVDLEPSQGRFALAGHFIQDTVLRRTQVFDPDMGIVKDERVLPSAPSAFFVLTLDDHKLIYYGESLHAPDLSTFRATVDNFIDKKYRQFIDRLYEQENEGAPVRRVTKAALKRAHLEPTLEIVPIASSEGVEEFIARYSRVKRLDIVVHKRNKDIDASEVLEGIDALRERLGADKSKLTTSDPNGLSPEGTIETLNEAGASGNQTINVSGDDHDGNTLNGTNEDFSVKTQVELPPLETPDTARELYARMKELMATGALKISAPLPAVVNRVAMIIGGLML